MSLFLAVALASAEPVQVQNPEGSQHAFLALRSLHGELLASGDLTQTVHGELVSTRLIFRFRDGSIDDETTTYVQKGVFRLLRDHHEQRGPSYPKPLDMTLDAESGVVTVRSEDHGKSGVVREHIALPADLSNGILFSALKNIPADKPETKLAYLAAGPKPRLVELTIKPAGQARFRFAGYPYRANRFDIHVDLRGLDGVIAPLIGKQPHDTSVWVIPGEVPALVCVQGPLYPGGPVWSIEPAGPKGPLSR